MCRNMQAVLMSFKFKRGLLRLVGGKAGVSLLRCEGEVVGPAQPDYGMNEGDVVVKDLGKEEGKGQNLILENGVH